jgi:hypothetical protein
MPRRLHELGEKDEVCDVFSSLGYPSGVESTPNGSDSLDIESIHMAEAHRGMPLWICIEGIVVAQAILKSARLPAM